MKCLGTCIVLGVIVLASAANLNLHPLSDENIALINQKAKTWKAGKNFEMKEWDRVKKIMSGVLPYTGERKIAKAQPHLEIDAIPESFDSREAWPQCESLKTIWDQSNCGSCWAIAATAAMSDRICIHSNQTRQTFVSVEDLNTCCYSCGNGCDGGNPDLAWSYWNSSGIVTGGLYQGNQGCKDYTLIPCEHNVDYNTRPQCSSVSSKTPYCFTICSDRSMDYKESLTFGEIPSYFEEEQQIQLEILKNGPVETSFTVMDDFASYKSGVYQATSGISVGRHSMKILGWGVEDGTPYWLIANSWNTDWGLDGYVKFLRGENHLKIESNCVAALPIL
ncbi:hypothetical protein GWI33_010120 [Rhynchophorus ferrugineus]|uniref:Peptidase C1A papain C-terminal domain-containing protein n=1 Tax=Rhynchophorus ferrugineus TaxID=354439 RepID=A0A834IRE5_RHYFE|nr:hypothetical protein GWI33_010120 [Rhynchophorus ferrugineus]